MYELSKFDNNLVDRKYEIIMNSLGGLDFKKYEYGSISFDYEQFMDDINLGITQVQDILRNYNVGNTPLIYLKRLTDFIRKKYAKKGYGAKIYIKNETLNPTGSIKDRAAIISFYKAKSLGYKQAIVFNDDNFGISAGFAGVISNLKTIIVNTNPFIKYNFSHPVYGIIERNIEKYNAELIQVSDKANAENLILKLLDQEKSFYSSVYSNCSVSGMETAGYELSIQLTKLENEFPDALIVPLLGGAELTGVTRGILRAKANCRDLKNIDIIGCTVDYTNLDSYNINDLKKQIFPYHNVNFAIPYLTWHDSTLLPRNASRPLRYLDRLVFTTQGEILFSYMLMLTIEGLDLSLESCIPISTGILEAINRKEDEIVVIIVSDKILTHPEIMLGYASSLNLEIKKGNPESSDSRINILIPETIDDMYYYEYPLKLIKDNFLRNLILRNKDKKILREDIKFLYSEILLHPNELMEKLFELLSQFKMSSEEKAELEKDSGKNSE